MKSQTNIALLFSFRFCLFSVFSSARPRLVKQRLHLHLSLLAPRNRPLGASAATLRALARPNRKGSQLTLVYTVSVQNILLKIKYENDHGEHKTGSVGATERMHAGVIYRRFVARVVAALDVPISFFAFHPSFTILSSVCQRAYSALFLLVSLSRLCTETPMQVRLCHRQDARRKMTGVSDALGNKISKTFQQGYSETASSSGVAEG
jgi:hypothetical protein